MPAIEVAEEKKRVAETKHAFDEGEDLGEDVRKHRWPQIDHPNTYCFTTKQRQCKELRHTTVHIDMRFL
jgi:hypothetical protein